MLSHPRSAWPARLAAALGLLGIALLSPAAAQAPAASPPMTDPQRAAIEGVIRDYLLKNPEIIQEAIGELEKRRDEAQKTAQARTLKDQADLIYRSPRGNVIGNPNGDVTLVEFFDYNCGYCKRALADLVTMTKADPKLRVVLKDFPVLGPESVAAARVAVAAKQQLSGDRLFDYHQKLLGSSGPVTGERALAVAKEMGLDMARLQKDMAGAEVRATIAENAELGERLNLTGTPAYVVGDEVISGAVGAGPLRQAVNSVRQCGKATC